MQTEQQVERVSQGAVPGGGAGGGGRPVDNAVHVGVDPAEHQRELLLGRRLPWPRGVGGLLSVLLLLLLLLLLERRRADGNGAAPPGGENAPRRARGCRRSWR